MADIDLNNLDFSNIGSLPLLVKGILIAVVAVAVLAAGYFRYASTTRQACSSYQ